MASVYKRQFRHRVSTKHLLDGKTEIITSHGSGGTTVDISVFDIRDGGDWERDTLTRYLFRLTVEEASDLTKRLQSLLAEV